MGEQVLSFLKGKRDTVQCAEALAERLALPPAQDALAALEPLEETALKAQLRTAFAGGVAFHPADLPPGERAVGGGHHRSGGGGGGSRSPPPGSGGQLPPPPRVPRGGAGGHHKG